MKIKFSLRKILPAFLLIAAGFTPQQMSAEEPAVRPVKYVFLFIGDGMSTPHRMVTDLFLKSQGKAGLTMNRFETQGFTTTNSQTSLITDSAAAATAMATGSKTYSGAIGVDKDRKKLETVAELAKKTGKRVGIMTTTSINHATPAGFYAHQFERSSYYAIGLDMLNSGFDYFAGGGLYDHAGNWVPESGKKGDLYELLPKKGFTFIHTKDAFEALKPGAKLPVYIRNPHLAQEDTVYHNIDRLPGDVTLADFVQKAIDLLDGDAGFFILCEGGKIDWTAHGNDPGGTIAEVIGFDEAITRAYEFAKKHPAETLIVVTGDHDTGAMTMGYSGTGYSLYVELLGAQKTSAWQAANDFAALRQEKEKNKQPLTFEDAKKFVTDHYGLKFEGNGAKDRLVLTPYEIARLKLAFERSVSNPVYAENENPRILYGGYLPIVIQSSHILSNKAGISWTSFDHSAMPVATSAHGVNAFLFGNLSDNTDIAKNLRKVLTAK